jgi:hypothetical protein
MEAIMAHRKAIVISLFLLGVCSTDSKAVALECSELSNDLVRGNTVVGQFRTPSGPAALTGPDGQVVGENFVVSARGRDDGIYVQQITGVSDFWSEVSGFGLTLSEPSAVVHGDFVRLFVRGTDNEIWENKLAPDSRWTKVQGGLLTLSGPAAGVFRRQDGSGELLKLFARDTDGRIYEVG